MFFKFRIWGWLFGILLAAAGLAGFYNTLGQAADADSQVVYLPAVWRPENTPTPTPTPVVDFEARVVELTNQARLANGCGPVTMDSRLQSAAEGHSMDMAINDFFSHTGSDGSSPWDRIRAAGYSFSLAGENIAAGYTSPESVMAGWMSSPGHRANILNCGFVHIGVGYYYLYPDTGSVNYRHYWTQVFAAP